MKEVIIDKKNAKQINNNPHLITNWQRKNIKITVHSSALGLLSQTVTSKLKIPPAISRACMVAGKKKKRGRKH